MAMAATMPITYEKIPRLTKFRKKKTPPPKTVTRMIVSIDSRLFFGAGSMMRSEVAGGSQGSSIIVQCARVRVPRKENDLSQSRGTSEPASGPHGTKAGDTLQT